MSEKGAVVYHPVWRERYEVVADYGDGTVSVLCDDGMYCTFRWGELVWVRGPQA